MLYCYWKVLFVVCIWIFIVFSISLKDQCSCSSIIIVLQVSYWHWRVYFLWCPILRLWKRLWPKVPLFTSWTCLLTPPTQTSERRLLSWWPRCCRTNWWDPKSESSCPSSFQASSWMPWEIPQKPAFICSKVGIQICWYSETRLIRRALGQTFCVGTDNVKHIGNCH